MKRIYCDTAAGWANPSSIHHEGVVAREHLDQARAASAKVLSAHPDELIFTSGGTESNNLAIFGVARAWEKIHGQPGEIITTPIEHRSILAPGEVLKTAGWQINFLPVDREGLVNPAELKKLLKPDTVLVSVGYANNEIGTIQPIHDLAKVIRQFKKANPSNLIPNPYPLFHTDACQATRFLDLNPLKLGVDLLTFNAAKIYGPNGIGCLYAKRGLTLEPLIVGGGQEGDRRSGTENVAGVVGLAAALELCAHERVKESQKLSRWRDYFISQALKLPGVELNGSPTKRLPNNVNLFVSGVEAEQLVIELDARGIACSTGSACSLPKHDESYVIMALGFNEERARSSVRFTFGRDITRTEINYILKTLAKTLEKLREFNQW